MVTSRRDLGSLLRRFEIPQNGVLFVHSAFKQLAHCGHEPHAIIDSIIDYMKDGTVLMPTMSWRTVNLNNPVFDEIITPSNTGILTEIFRTAYATARSIHPTHSVSGLDPLAKEILATHHVDYTPCSIHSPFGMLPERNAWIIMLGVSVDCLTLVHHYEELVAPDLYLHPANKAEASICRLRDGSEHTVRLRRHLTLARDFWQFQDRLAQTGDLKVGALDSVIVRAFSARKIGSIIYDVLKHDPSAIIAQNGQRYRVM